MGDKMKTKYIMKVSIMKLSSMTLDISILEPFLSLFSYLASKSRECLTR